MRVELRKAANEFGPILTLVQESGAQVFSTVDDGFGIWRVENFINSAGRMTLTKAYEGCSLRVTPRKFAS